jgi:pimeloyl-ACP methyl ester carboxylesterase
MPTGSSHFGRQKLAFSLKATSRTPMLNRFIYRNYQATKSAMQAWLAKCCFVNPELVTAEMVDVFTTCAQQYGAEYAILNLQTGHLNFDLEARVKMLTQPVTLLWGNQPMNPAVETAYAFQETIKNCSLVVLQDTGVFAALESPAAMTEVLHEELQNKLRVYKTS